MSRDSNPILNLNSIDRDQQLKEEGSHEEDLQIFSNTTFFDLDIGRSTDIATTVDELLMQQEKQIQYPHKQQPLDNDYGPVAGPSYTPQPYSENHGQQPYSNGVQESPAHNHNHHYHHQYPNKNLPFDFSTLQEFSLAGELPQASLSIYDVDPIIHDHTNANTNARNPRLPNANHDANGKLEHSYRYVGRQPPIQRHELADHYQPKENSSRAGSVPSSKSDDEKRKRNTAASARFRVKKKLREQELEKTHRQMQQRLTEQEERIKQLEMENIWLKSLVVEKNLARDTSSLGKLREELLKKEQS